MAHRVNKEGGGRPCAPYHATDGDTYHTYSDCPVGRNIPPNKRRQGLGHRKLCPVCRDLKVGRKRR